MFHALDQVDNEGLEQIYQRQDIVPVKVLVLEEVLEGAHPEVRLEGHEEKYASVDKAVILAIVLNKERLNPTVHLNELPELVKHRLVKGEAERDLLENFGRLARY